MPTAHEEAQPLPEPNFPNRTLAIMDNLEFLRATDNESVDLIAIDPPFAANETFEGAPKPPITDAERRAEFTLAASHGEAALERYRKEDKQLTRVKDDWFWRDVDESWMKALKDAGDRVRVDLEAGDAPSGRDRTLDAMREVIEAVSACANENEAAYIAEMSVRLLECHRVLKPTGSIYVHCDYRANSYLRMLMDVIFGHKNFRNQIAWCYTGPANTPRWFPRKYDTILFYAGSEAARFYRDAVRVPYKEGVTEKARGSGSAAIWSEGHDEERMADLARIGKVPEDWWTEETQGFSPVGRSGESTGYSTQKPLALYRRIIRASSNPGDTVLDLFAGCATTVVAAEMEGRKWLACDHAYRASTMMMRRFYQNGHQLRGMDVDVVRGALGEHQIQFKHPDGQIIGPPDVADYPRLTTDPDNGVPALRTARRAPISTNWLSPISKADSKSILLDKWGPICWGCGFDATRPNGTVNLSQLEVDHIQARNALDGVRGGDGLHNLALLCAYCNKHKGNRLTLAELRTENAHDGVLYVNTIDDLKPHEYDAREFAIARMIEHGYQPETA